MRKSWMRGLKDYKFTADGTMLSDTYYEQKRANSRDAGCVGGSRTNTSPIRLYAATLGIDVVEAQGLCAKHKKLLGP